MAYAVFRTDDPVADAEAYYNWLDSQPQEEDTFVGYCDGCGERIEKDDDHIYYDGCLWCENCMDELVMHIIPNTEAKYNKNSRTWEIRDREFGIGADIDANGEITYLFHTSVTTYMEKDYFDIFVDGVAEVAELIKEGVI